MIDPLADKNNQSINQSCGSVQSTPYVTRSQSEVSMDHCQWRGV